MSRHLPIQGNPNLPPWLEHKPFFIWQQKGLTKFSTLCNLETGLHQTFTVIVEKFYLPQSHAFHFCQSVSFIHNSCREEEKIQSDYYRSSAPRRLLYYIWHLQTSHSKDHSYYSILISNKLGRDFPDADIIEKLLLGYNKIPNESWTETQLKILHRAYIPFLSEKNNQNSATCLCHQARPSLTYHFWPCTYISTFWDQVISFIYGITLLKLQKDPLLLIFGYWDKQLMLSSSANSLHKDWIVICLLVAEDPF